MHCSFKWKPVYAHDAFLICHFTGAHPTISQQRLTTTYNRNVDSTDDREQRQSPIECQLIAERSIINMTPVEDFDYILTPAQNGVSEIMIRGCNSLASSLRRIRMLVTIVQQDDWLLMNCRRRVLGSQATATRKLDLPTAERARRVRLPAGRDTNARYSESHIRYVRMSTETFDNQMARLSSGFVVAEEKIATKCPSVNQRSHQEKVS